VCRTLSDETGLRTVALSGGCFQNRLFLEVTASRLAADGVRLLTHHQTPCNDGGLSLGQAVIAGLHYARHSHPM
jgi:hydrogenase maturation protein HypF